jgi:hypothetical protein
MYPYSLTPGMRQVWGRIDALDLDPIKIKLMDEKEGKGWTRAFADRIDVQYRQFLKLSALKVGIIVPNKFIDDFWHNHILDTRKYAEDCEIVFGYFLHHFPYLGMRGEDDRRNLASAFNQTLGTVRQIFGDQADWSIGTLDSLEGSSICKSCVATNAQRSQHESLPRQKCRGNFYNSYTKKRTVSGSMSHQKKFCSGPKRDCIGEPGVKSSVTGSAW